METTDNIYEWLNRDSRRTKQLTKKIFQDNPNKRMTQNMTRKSTDYATKK